MSQTQLFSLALVAGAAASATYASTADAPKVLVTGATGGTGQLLYAQLKADARIGEVRALVRAGSAAADKARKALNCSKCDASEGIYYGDVTDPVSLVAPSLGMDTVAIAVGVGETANKTLMKDVEFIGVKNQVAALATQAGATAADVSAMRVVLCSSMATTNPHPLPFEGGPVLFWKLNAEAFVTAHSMGATIVKPCGIEGTYGRGGKQLITGHDDVLVGKSAGAISREDVAAVMTEAVVERASGLRFDICIGSGAPTTDLGALLQGTRYPWERPSAK